MEANKPKTASDHDRDYFRRLGEFERANDEDARREHFALSLDERLLVSAMITARTPYQAFDEHPEELYERARHLGLYRHTKSA